MHRLLQRLAAGIVFAVGNHEQHFLLQLGAFLQMVGRGDQRVVKRRAAAGFNFLQAFLQFLDVTGVILVQVVLVIEIDDKNLVIFIAGANQIECSLVYTVALFAHRSGIIDDDSHGDRDVLVTDRSDGLGLAVLQNCVGALVEVRDNVLLVINHGGVEHDLLRARVKDEATALRTGFLARGGWWSLRRLSRAWLRRSRLSRTGLRLRRRLGRCWLRRAGLHWGRLLSLRLGRGRRCWRGISWSSILRAGSLRPTSQVKEKYGNYNKQEPIIAKVHSNPFLHRREVAANPLAQSASLLSYAIFRHAPGSLDGSRVHIGCVAQSQFL